MKTMVAANKINDGFTHLLPIFVRVVGGSWTLVPLIASGLDDVEKLGKQERLPFRL